MHMKRTIDGKIILTDKELRIIIQDALLSYISDNTSNGNSGRIEGNIPDVSDLISNVSYANDAFVQDNISEMNEGRCLNEMAQVNKNERGLNKKASFDANLYRVYVIEEGAFAKFPHFHIEMPSEGWDIRMNMDGSYHSMKRRGGANRQKDEDFKDIERIAKVWVKQPNTLYPQMTNGQAAQFLWDSMN